MHTCFYSMTLICLNCPRTLKTFRNRLSLSYSWVVFITKLSDRNTVKKWNSQVYLTFPYGLAYVSNRNSATREYHVPPKASPANFPYQLTLLNMTEHGRITVLNPSGSPVFSLHNRQNRTCFNVAEESQTTVSAGLAIGQRKVHEKAETKVLYNHCVCTGMKAWSWGGCNTSLPSTDILVPSETHLCS